MPGYIGSSGPSYNTEKPCFQKLNTQVRLGGARLEEALHWARQSEGKEDQESKDNLGDIMSL